jgi:ribonuclease P protein component
VNATRGGPTARGEASGQTLPASHRLRHRSQFQKVQERGQRYAVGALVLLVLPNNLGHRRLGVTVSSKVGNSVVRSKIKRWFREIFRKRRALLPPSVDAVLIARSGAAASSLQGLGRDFEAAAEQAKRRAQGRSGPGPAVEKGVR